MRHRPAPLALAAAALAAVLAGPAAAGAAPGIACDTPPGIGAPHAPPHTAVLEDPFGEAPRLTGAGGTVPVRLFRRGRTLIWDAGDQVIYIDRDRLDFTYQHTGRGAAAMTTWHGRCRPL